MGMCDKIIIVVEIIEPPPSNHLATILPSKLWSPLRSLVHVHALELLSSALFSFMHLDLAKETIEPPLITFLCLEPAAKIATL